MGIVDRLADCLGGAPGAAVRAAAEQLTELRVRVGQPVQLRCFARERLIGPPVSPEDLRKLLDRLMEGSVYAWENELRQGYFTISGGCRVGVCGRMRMQDGRVAAMTGIGSICVRVPREAPGCANGILPLVLGAGGPLKSVLILSAPGMGKTTLVRDLARGVSAAGHSVAIADERRELAACLEGVPQLDVGPRTDVMDSCPKALSIGMLLRACAPEMIVADELGGAADARAVREAVRCGVRVAATAHADSFEAARRRAGIGELLRENIFDWAVLLGQTPGTVAAVREYGVKGG